MLVEPCWARHRGSYLEGDEDAHRQDFMSCLCVGGKTEPHGCQWGRPEQALGDKSDERRCHVVNVPGLHASKYGSGGGGQDDHTPSVYVGREDAQRRGDKKMKTLQLVPVKSHRSSSRPQLMKRRAKGSREETKSHFWHGRSDRVMWEWTPCKWHILPICGVWIIWNSKEIQRQISVLKVSGRSRTNSRKDPLKRTRQRSCCLSASVFMPLITTPHQACLHIVHRWQRWSLGWRPPKPELFIFCEGGKRNPDISQKSVRKIGALRKHLPASLQSAAEPEWRAPSDMWQHGIHTTAQVKRGGPEWPPSKKRSRTVGQIPLLPTRESSLIHRDGESGWCAAEY